MRHAAANAWRARIGAAVCWVCLSASAYALDDPTRPPTGLQTGGNREGVEGEVLTLQSVIISDAERSAIISGVHVKLGGTVGSARLVQVSEAEVVVLVGGSRRTLKLFSGVRKTQPTARESEPEKQYPRKAK
jgi:hypothetical protein